MSIDILLGGAMKPTTNGQWAHLTCAMWIPGVRSFQKISIPT